MCKHSGYTFLHVAIPRIYKETYLGPGPAWACVMCPGGGYNFLHVAISRIYKETYLGPGPAWARVTCPGGGYNMPGTASPAACCRCIYSQRKEL